MLLVRGLVCLVFLVGHVRPTVYLVGSAYKDLFSVGAGFKNVVSWGVFPLNDAETEWLLKPGVYIEGKDQPVDKKLIKEYCKYSWYDDATTGLHPSQGKTVPMPHKPGAYSFLKAPRYNDKSCEVGPLARMWVQNPELSPMGQKALQDKFGLKAKNFRDLGDLAFSVMGRHVARAEETWVVANYIEKLIKEIKPGDDTWTPCEVPATGEGMGMTEAPRGSLLHYVDIKGKKIANYQSIPATLWNTCPRDDMGQRGPVEQALIGVPVPDVKNPVNLGRLVRAFDP